MKRIETLLEKISSTGLILYIAGIISLIACAIATVVNNKKKNNTKKTVGAIGLALIGKAERKRLTKKN